jgi:hypothetical protein
VFKKLIKGKAMIQTALLSKNFEEEGDTDKLTQPSTQKIMFLVQGLEKEPYQIMFTRVDEDGHHQLICECECISAAHGDLCGHRLRILEGSTSHIVSDNRDQVYIVQQWLMGTELEQAVRELVKAEKLLDYAERQLSTARNQLAEIMAGGEMTQDIDNH